MDTPHLLPLSRLQAAARRGRSPGRWGEPVGWRTRPLCAPREAGGVSLGEPLSALPGPPSPTSRIWRFVRLPGL